MKIITSALPGMSLYSTENLNNLADELIDRLMRTMFTGRYILDRMVMDHDIELDDAEDGFDALMDAVKQYELDRNDETCLDFETYIEDKLEHAFPLERTYVIEYTITGSITLDAHSENEARDRFDAFTKRELQDHLDMTNVDIIDVDEE